MFWVPESFVCEYVETAIIQNLDIVRAKSLLRGPGQHEAMCGLMPKDVRPGWQAIAKTLQGLAYDIAADDVWLQLGVAPLAGSAPCEAAGEQRWRVARTILDYASPSGFSEAERCQARLPQQTCPRWAEARGDSGIISLGLSKKRVPRCHAVV